MPRLVYNMQTMLQVRDLRESIAFYTEVLGFKVDGTWPPDEPTWAGLTSGNARMMLSIVEGVTEMHFTGVIYMYPDDIDAAWEQLREKVEVVEAIETRPYGMRDFSFRDPNGYFITLGQSADAAREHEQPHEHEHEH